MRNRNLVFLLTIIPMLILYSCGGGGGGNEDNYAPAKQEDSNANLGSVTISSGSLVFDPDITAYLVEVDYSVYSVTLIPTLANIQASLKVNGTDTISGNPFGPVNLNVGTNSIEIAVTATDRSTTKTYTIFIIRLEAGENSRNANLVGLVLSNGILTPSFSSDILEYSAEVSNPVASVTVTPTAAGVNASIKVNGNTVESGTASKAIPLNVGKNDIIIKVTAEESTFTRTYTISLTRFSTTEKSDNADLAGMVLSKGVLTPAFSSDIMEYSAEVSNSISSVTVIPTAAGVNASIKVNGFPVKSGAASLPIFLFIGNNTINIKVTAEDGLTIKTYKIIVTRLKDNENSNDANLADLKLSEGMLLPPFYPTMTAYIAQVPKSASYIMVTPTASGVNSTITVNGADVISGTPSQAIGVDQMLNVITIVVTAGNADTRTYYIFVVKEDEEGEPTPPLDMYLSIPLNGSVLDNAPSFLLLIFTDTILFTPNMLTVSGLTVEDSRKLFFPNTNFVYVNLSGLSMTPGGTYHFTLTGVKDTNGNTMDSKTIYFSIK